MKISPLGIESFHAGGQTDRRDEVNSPFFAILRKHLNVVIKGDGFFPPNPQNTASNKTQQQQQQ